MLSLPRAYFNDNLYNSLLPYRMDDAFPTFDQMLSKQLVKNDKFQVDFDLRNFDPNGIKVKFEDGMLEVSAKQEKKGDGHYEYRQFIRKINVPKEVDEAKMKCSLDKDGRLRLEAPVKKPEALTKEIPIQMINQK